jgi:glycosyltransferase involved in cell wall biosynthesis
MGDIAPGPRVVIVHDYFTQLGGAERVVAQMAEIFPEAAIRASVVDQDLLPPGLRGRCVSPTGLQPLIGAGVPLAALAPFLSSAFKRMDFGTTDVVVSSTSAFAHHVRVPPAGAHVAYVHTPPRFLWSPEGYFARDRGQGLLLTPALAWLRRRDRAAMASVDVLLANSAWTAARIKEVHYREAEVLYPPIEVGRFQPTTRRSGRFLIVSRLRPYKRLEVAIQAANRLRVGLDVIGSGTDLARLRAFAGPTVRFHGRLGDDAVSAAMASCAGLVVPGIEDFGLTMAEVQASGRPPLAFAAGGALEIIRDGETGFLVEDASPAGVAEAMERALAIDLPAERLVESAERFAFPVFERRLRAIVDACGTAG